MPANAPTSLLTSSLGVDYGRPPFGSSGRPWVGKADHFYGSAVCAPQRGDEEGGDDEIEAAPRDPALLVNEDSKFCLGPKEQVHLFLDIERDATRWPLIPIAELHASSVQHPDDVNMRWLLHSRRVPRQPLEPTEECSLPPCAGVGKKEESSAWGAFV